jgi:hypothetical protein
MAELRVILAIILGIPAPLMAMAPSAATIPKAEWAPPAWWADSPTVRRAVLTGMGTPRANRTSRIE